MMHSIARQAGDVRPHLIADVKEALDQYPDRAAHGSAEQDAESMVEECFLSNCPA